MPPEAYAILLHADEMPDGGFEPPDADEGVEAGAGGPLVDDADAGVGVQHVADHRKGVSRGKRS